MTVMLTPPTLLHYQFLDSLVVRISACHVEGPGSIPGRGELFATLLTNILVVANHCHCPS